MADTPKPPDALLFKLNPIDHEAPMFITPAADKVAFWRWRGWFLLADEREIRRADVNDVRKQDESRWKKPE